MNEVHFDWDNLRLFLAVARSGGLGPASKLTGKSAPTLGRRMLELERSLGQDLFYRKARGYDLTEDGQALLARIRGVEALVASVAETSGPKVPPLVKISAGTWVTRVLASSVDEIIGSVPVRLRFMSSDRLSDIGHREAVIGVRNSRPNDIGLAVRKVGRVRFAVYAKNENVATWARVLSSTPSANWVREQVRDANTIEVTGPQNALDLANAGVARAVLPTFVGNTQPELVPLSDPIEALDHDQWLVSHHEDRFLPEVRNVLDRIHALLKKVCADR